MDGILNVNKPVGMSSHDVVAGVRKMVPGVKIGHAGTLDPAASGVLPLCLGRGTRIVEYMMDQVKGYRAGVELGVSTDTGDLQGRVLQRCSVPELEQGHIEEILASLIGIQQQVPPVFSAIKHKGKPLYYWARRGKEVQRKPRTIKVYEIKLIEIHSRGRPHLLLDIQCSRGTYIRSIAEEIGQRMSCGAYLCSLVRLYVGSFKIENSCTLEELRASGDVSRFILPVDRALGHLKALTVEDPVIDDLKHGRKAFPGQGFFEKWDFAKEDRVVFRIYDSSGKFMALARVNTTGHPGLQTVKFLARTD